MLAELLQRFKRKGTQNQMTGVFSSAAAAARDQAKTQLADTQAEIASLERQLDAAAIALVLDPDNAAEAERLQAAILAAKSRADLLRRASGIADQAERERLAEQAAKDERKRKRQIAQHLAQVEKHAVAVADAQAAAREAFGRLAGSVQAVKELLPPSALSPSTGVADALRVDRLRWYAEAAAYGQSRDDAEVAPGHENPGGVRAIEDHNGAIPSFSTLIKERCTNPVRRHLDPSTRPVRIPPPIPAEAPTEFDLPLSPSVGRGDEPPAGISSSVPAGEPFTPELEARMARDLLGVEPEPEAPAEAVQRVEAELANDAAPDTDAASGPSSPPAASAAPRRLNYFAPALPL